MTVFKNVNIKTPDGTHFLTAVNGGGTAPVAKNGIATNDLSAAGPNETFQLIPQSGAGAFALRTADGKHFVTASNGGGIGDANAQYPSRDPGNTFPLHTDAVTAGPSETFTVTVDSSTSPWTAKIQTANGDYLTAVSGGGIGDGGVNNTPVHTDQTSIGPWEVWSMNQPLFQVQDLGTFGPFDLNSSVTPSGINDNGTIVGSINFPDTKTTSTLLAFSFTTRHGILSLGSYLEAGPSNFAGGVNAAGQIAFNAESPTGVGKYLPGILNASATTALTPCALLDAPPYNSVPPANYFAAGINDQGEVVGEATFQDSPSSTAISVPFLSNGRSALSLGSLGGARGGALAINNSGHIVGHSQTAAMPQPDPPEDGHAFLYSSATGLQDLNSLVSDPSFVLIQASDINEGGEIVGYGLLSSAYRAFHYQNGAVQNLGTFPVDGGNSFAQGNNNRGDIVGHAAFSNVDLACLFLQGFTFLDAISGVINLNDHIDSSLGWTLGQAVAINNGGQIVGFGTNTNTPGQRGFLLTPP